MKFSKPTGFACAAIGIAALLEGCAPQPRPSTTRLFAVDQRGAARSCTVPRVTAVAGREVPVTMAVGNDGGWCAITVDSGGRSFSHGLVTARAQNGSVFIHSVGDATRIDYTPDRGFAGTDSFTVKLRPGDAILRASVAVTRG
ncbi:MAG: hypothetical protein J2P47_00085 [Acetobacteraceae bacterium]|nr:hypothetical protein [Acetobacteraceae bacterium]